MSFYLTYYIFTIYFFNIFHLQQQIDLQSEYLTRKNKSKTTSKKHVPPPAVGGGGGCGPNHFLSLIVTDTVAVTVTKAVSKTVSAGACNCTYSRNYNSVCN